MDYRELSLSIGFSPFEWDFGIKKQYRLRIFTFGPFWLTAIWG